MLQLLLESLHTSSLHVLRDTNPPCLSLCNSRGARPLRSAARFRGRERARTWARGEQWLALDAVSEFDGLERLIVLAVGLDALRSAAAAAWRGDAAGALQPPPPSTPPGSPERRRTTEDRIRHGVDIQHRSSAGGIYGDVGRSPPRSPRRKLVL